MGYLFEYELQNAVGDKKTRGGLDVRTKLGYTLSIQKPNTGRVQGRRNRWPEPLETLWTCRGGGFPAPQDGEAPVSRREAAAMTEKACQTEELPLCVLGPGGDFRSVVEYRADSEPVVELSGRHCSMGQAFETCPGGGWLSECLARFDAALQAACGRWQPSGAALGHARTRPEDYPIVVFGPQGLVRYVEKDHVRGKLTSFDAETTAYSHADPGFPAQAWLFPDDAGAGRHPRRYQGHRVRTRQRPRAKRPIAAIETQGTFFGAYIACGVSR